MTPLNQLAKAALLGAERSPIELPPLPGQAAGLALPPGEDGVLMAAGLLGLYREAGFIPPVGSEALPAASAAEDLALLPAPVATLLRNIIATDFAALIGECLRHLKQNAWRVPAAELPALLDLGAKHTGLQADIIAVAGARGRWLAASNPEWGYFTATRQPDLWEEGTLPERVRYLRSLRGTDPDQAREKLAAGFDAEPAKNRGMLLAVLADGLSMRDEAFLHDILTDRGKEVAKTAAKLLSRLPQSRLAQQAQTLLASCLRQEGALKKHWAIEPPAEFSAALKALAIQEKVSFGKDIGQRAGWLLQLVTITPLEWWNETLRESPETLYAQAKKSEWRAALRRGWEQAAVDQRHAGWAKALIQTAKLRGAALFVLDAADLEAVTLELLQKEPKQFSSHLQPLLDTTLRQRRHWGESVSRELLRAVQQHIQDKQAYYDYELRNAFTSLACALHPAVLPHALEGWPVESAHWGYFAEAFAEFSRFVQLRLELATRQ